MDTHEVSRIVTEVIDLVETRYVEPDAAPAIARVLRGALARGRYDEAAAVPGGDDARALAAAVTADLQSVNGDKHLRLLYHEEPLAERTPGDDAVEYAAMARWADRTGGGVGRVERLPGNIGLIDLRPVIFPAVISGDRVSAAMSLVACTEALIIDVRNCVGGEPSAVAFVLSYVFGHEPVELTGLYERETGRLKQAWTLAHVPGLRFGPDRPVSVLTSATTFSGGEALAYDVQQTSRGTLFGERTRGGAHARLAFRLHPHLEATISAAKAVNPVSGTNWEGVGVAPDVETGAAEAFDRAYLAALEPVAAGSGPDAGEARAELAARRSGTGHRPEPALAAG